ncbi:IclR family transcriptional regulator [Vineibacter terrae]|uniref:IclR family transcriptional regulator n=1 Tax=Vineibacter terrae TaxID=2586908 RepID=UPI002E322000|nr:IclR family transcriptional regulator [Vineibacter terrae]HEX2889172.1 IclR family transcriptional regulator [Vineibacter terrae]
MPRRSAVPRRVPAAFAEHAGDRQFATTLARGLEILRCFTPQQPVLSTAELARRTGLPKPTVSRFTYTLSGMGYLRPDLPAGRYRLGPAVLSLGYPLIASFAFRQVVRPAMEALARQVSGSVSLGLRDRTNMVYVETCRSAATSSFQLSDIGMTHPIAATAIGRAHIASCPPAERAALLNELRVKTPELWRQHAASVTQALAAFRDKGYCVSYGDLRPGIYALATPIGRLPSRELLVLNAVSPSWTRRAAQFEPTLAPLLLRCAHAIAAQITA